MDTIVEEEKETETVETNPVVPVEDVLDSKQDSISQDTVPLSDVSSIAADADIVQTAGSVQVEILDARVNREKETLEAKSLVQVVDVVDTGKDSTTQETEQSPDLRSTSAATDIDKPERPMQAESQDVRPKKLAKTKKKKKKKKKSVPSEEFSYKKRAYQDVVSICCNSEEKLEVFIKGKKTTYKEDFYIIKELIGNTLKAAEKLRVFSENVSLLDVEDVIFFYELIRLYNNCGKAVECLHSSYAWSFDFIGDREREDAGNKLHRLSVVLWRGLTALNQQVKTTVNNCHDIILIRGLCFLLSAAYKDLYYFCLDDHSSDGKERKNFLKM